MNQKGHILWVSKQTEPNMTYQVIDTKTQTVVATCKTSKAARAKQDRLDLAYGAVRYTVRMVED
jgi:hypothetical protein